MSDMEFSSSEKDVYMLRSKGESFHSEAEESASQSNGSCP